MNITDEVRDLLVNVDYPASKDALVTAAEQRGGTDEALRALRAVPPVDYGNADEVLRSIDIHPRDRSGRTPGDEGRRRRRPNRTGLAEHLRETERSPIEEELGTNRGS